MRRTVSCAIISNLFFLTEMMIFLKPRKSHFNLSGYIASSSVMARVENENGATITNLTSICCPLN